MYYLLKYRYAIMKDIEIVLSRLNTYCKLTHFECIVKEI